jgi:hypothetical protein
MAAKIAITQKIPAYVNFCPKMRTATVLTLPTGPFANQTSDDIAKDATKWSASSIYCEGVILVLPRLEGSSKNP